MPTVRAKYLGNQRVECTHLESGTVIVTDPPRDNGGQGSAFSATDLPATALGACALGMMARYAENHGLDLDGAEAEITKVMADDLPRRIAAINVVFYLKGRKYSEKEKTVLKNVTDLCPVRLSLHPDIKQNISFEWAD